ncbi:MULTISPECIES: DUF4177 domain-containing protein [unclassified Yoonia]|uniref:DUF4177 domain-containing protein n=1 Tax=unclassified Yoonia TaxID=2629118 RepID=UPI002AFFF3EF|nr:MULTISPECIES: DUF4177 domain-containing protein [unclassified Yoonia]
MTYEYKVIPAPMRGTKAPGVKSAEDRFALSLETAMNDLAADGWEYIRADTLPCEQREGLMSKTTVYQNMLVFRRAKVVNTAPKMKPQRPAPPVAPPAEKVQKKVVVSDETPSAQTAEKD